MRTEYAFLTSEGSARENNEDSVSHWQPQTPQQWRSHGSLVVLADGMGGQVRGEIASRMACNHVMSTFVDASDDSNPADVLRRGFTAANLAIYDDNMNHHRDWGRMATTLTASLFRNDSVTIAHVGDCRVYLIQQNRIRAVTSDHSYAAMQQKLGLITPEDMVQSDMRSVLTRSVGSEPFLRTDFTTVKLKPGDVVVQCCDGLWSKVSDGEILSIAGKLPPAEACKQLMRLAEKRFADDNLTVQVVRVLDIERLTDYRGQKVYWKEKAATMGHDLEVGQVLDDRYEITGLISHSGMASIYKAVDTVIDQPVALKVPFLHFESDPGFFSRFEREQKIGHALNHPYVLHLLDTQGLEKSRPYMVMEYLEGQTLGQLMHVITPTPVDDALGLAARICEALEYLHAHNITHRDLKPDNIMICNDGSIRIMDFGIAKYDGQRRLTFGGLTPAMGTPDYMAPEQVRGKRGDPRTDIYSLGAILYEMVTGHTPFEGANPFIIMNSRLSGDPSSPRKYEPSIPPQVEEIILHAMARSPDDRYPSAAALRADLLAPEKVEVTGRVDRLIEPNPLRTSWRKYKVFAAAVVLPLLAVACYWLSKHVQFK